MTGAEKRNLLDEITAVLQPAMAIQDDEITIQMAMERWACSDTRARRILNQAVEAGTMTVRDATTRQGYVCKAYRLVQDG